MMTMNYDNRITLSIDEQAFEQLKPAKGEYETWNGYLLSLLEESGRVPEENNE